MTWTCVSILAKLPKHRLDAQPPPESEAPAQRSGVRQSPASFTLTRVEHGDTAALTALFQRHHDGLCGYFTGPAHWYWSFVPDLVQETMARAVAALPRFRGRSDAEVQRWLFGIARNVHLQEVHRQMGRRLRQDLAYEIVRHRGHASQAPWMMCDLASGLQLLPLSQLEVLRLTLEGLTIREIAQRMDIPDGTVATRIHRARARLRAHTGVGVVNSR